MKIISFIAFLSILGNISLASSLNYLEDIYPSVLKLSHLEMSVKRSLIEKRFWMIQDLSYATPQLDMALVGLDEAGVSYFKDMILVGDLLLGGVEILPGQGSFLNKLASRAKEVNGAKIIFYH